MSSFIKTLSITALAVATLFINQSQAATCAKCAQIEKERAEEQAKRGPQPVRYYDDDFRNQVSVVDSASTPSITDTSSINRGTTGSTVNTGFGSSNTSTNTSTGTSTRGVSGTISGSTVDQGLPTRTTDRSAVGNTTSYNQTTVPTEQAYSTVYVILQSKDFLKTLNGPFTIFIPSNDALRRLQPGTVQDLLRPENRERLANLVGNHVVANKITDLNTNAKVKTVNGKEITIRSENGTPTINGARVLRVENVGSNGVLYIIDRVLAQ